MAGDPFGDAMNNIRKYVVSTTLKSASAWRNSTLIRDNVVEAVCQLKQQPGKNILAALSRATPIIKARSLETSTLAS
jgi:hypothetical protein